MWGGGGVAGMATACTRESICYVICCNTCKSTNISARYYGESSRFRGQEHSHGLEKKLEDNPLYKHDVLHHAGVKSEFTMKVLRQHKTPLARLIQESVEIEMSRDDLIMNSKGEYNGSRVPRIKIEVGARVLTGSMGRK